MIWGKSRFLCIGPLRKHGVSGTYATTMAPLGYTPCAIPDKCFVSWFQSKAWGLRDYAELDSKMYG